MSWGRRTSALVAVGVTVPWLVGCGGESEQAAPPEVVIPGSTVTIGTAPPGPLSEVPTTEVTSEPTSEPPSESPSAPSEPTSSPTEVPGLATSGRLLNIVATAIGAYDSVHVTTTEAAVQVESDHQILAGGSDYAAVVTTDGRSVELRRVGATLYTRSGGGPFATYVAGQETTSGDLAGEYLAWDVLGDLRTTLVSASAFEARDQLTYRWTVPWAALEGSPNLGGTGEVRVTLKIDEAGLPRRIEYADGNAPVSLTYSGWGDPVRVAAPDAG